MAIYYLTRWMSSAGKKVRLVELGPGRGTLMDDMLRASHVTLLQFALGVPLIGISDILRLSLNSIIDQLDRVGGEQHSPAESTGGETLTETEGETGRPELGRQDRGHTGM